MEWFAILIPIGVGVWLHHKHGHKVLWWEAALPMLVVPLVIWLTRLTAISHIISDSERHGGWVVEARYFEDWDEYIHKICCSTDKDGNTTCEDCSYVAYHPAYWELDDSNGKTFKIREDEYERLLARFGNKTFKDLHRWHHSNDGDLWFTRWQYNDEAFQPYTSQGSYENRILTAVGALAFPEVDEFDAKTLGLYKWPNVVDAFHDPAILGESRESVVADNKLQLLNARLGAEKQIRVWILLFHDQPRSTGLAQENYWKGGNKNELVICIGLGAGEKVQWCHPFCWSPDGYSGNDELKITIRDTLERQPRLQLVQLVEDLDGLVRHYWRRKPFAELAYVSVGLPGWAVSLCYLLSACATAGLSVWSWHNEHKDPHHAAC